MLCFRLNDVFNDKREDASQFMITVKHTGLVGNVIYIYNPHFKGFYKFLFRSRSTIFNNTAKKSTSKFCKFAAFEQECFMKLHRPERISRLKLLTIQHFQPETSSLHLRISKLKLLISDKARTASILSGLENEPVL
jgi:hypothetical protein